MTKEQQVIIAAAINDFKAVKAFLIHDKLNPNIADNSGRNRVTLCR